jgi:hypothetical protein
LVGTGSEAVNFVSLAVAVAYRPIWPFWLRVAGVLPVIARLALSSSRGHVRLLSSQFPRFALPRGGVSLIEKRVNFDYVNADAER